MATRTLSYNASIPVEGSFNGLVTLYKDPDVNRDHVVNVIDLATVAIAYGSTPTSSNWNAAADINNDGKVNVLDLGLRQQPLVREGRDAGKTATPGGHIIVSRKKQ